MHCDPHALGMWPMSFMGRFSLLVSLLKLGVSKIVTKQKMFSSYEVPAEAKT